MQKDVLVYGLGSLVIFSLAFYSLGAPRNEVMPGQCYASNSELYVARVLQIRHDSKDVVEFSDLPVTPASYDALGASSDPRTLEVSLFRTFYVHTVNCVDWEVISNRLGLSKLSSDLANLQKKVTISIAVTQSLINKQKQTAHRKLEREGR